MTRSVLLLLLLISVSETSLFRSTSRLPWAAEINMAPGSSYPGYISITSMVVATIGILFLNRKVVRAKTVTPHTATSATVTFSHTCGAKPTAFTVGLLEISIPRDDRPGGPFARVMINDACINRAVQEVSSKLIICVRDIECVPAGRVRAFVSNLYQEVHDAACAAHRPSLDVHVLLPKEAASALPRRGCVTSDSVLEVPGTGAAASTGESGSDSMTNTKYPWVTKGVVEHDPDLQVILSDALHEQYSAILNAERIRAGSPSVATVSLKEVASKAYKPEYFYAEDAAMDIPIFANVACGGTFDRLHCGHKKLLTFAASMCPEGTLTVGVTSDAMLKTKANAHMVARVDERLEGVRQFLRTINPHMKTRLVEITDPFGPPAKEEGFDAIVVSSETIAGAEKINELRAKRGFSPLAVGVTRRLAAATLSSTFLRENVPGEMIRNAMVSEGEARVKQGMV